MKSLHHIKGLFFVNVDHGVIKIRKKTFTKIKVIEMGESIRGIWGFLDYGMKAYDLIILKKKKTNKLL
jgi:hypothetical protein